MVLILYGQSHSLNMHAQLPSGARGLNIDLGLYLHSYCLYTSIKGSGETACMHRFV